MSYITKGAEDIMNAFYNTFAENREDFVIREMDKNAIAAVLRELANQLQYSELANQLQYNPNLPEDDMIINAWDVYEIANELEELK